MFGKLCVESFGDQMKRYTLDDSKDGKICNCLVTSRPTGQFLTAWHGAVFLSSLKFNTFTHSLVYSPYVYRGLRAGNRAGCWGDDSKQRRQFFLLGYCSLST